jgi:hypothetical protein
MPVAVLLAGAAERDAVQDRDVAGWMSVWNTEDERLCR